MALSAAIKVEVQDLEDTCFEKESEQVNSSFQNYFLIFMTFQGTSVVPRKYFKIMKVKVLEILYLINPPSPSKTLPGPRNDTFGIAKVSDVL